MVNFTKQCADSILEVGEGYDILDTLTERVEITKIQGVQVHRGICPKLGAIQLIFSSVTSECILTVF